MKNDSQDPFQKAQNTALSILARRRHSREEVRRKLTARGFEARIVEKVLSDCERLRYIDDETAADFFVEELVRKRFGLLRIKDAMRGRGFDQDLITRMIEVHRLPDREVEISQAAAAKKKAGWVDEKDERKMKEKLARFLRSRGFRPSTISAVLENLQKAGED